MIHRGSIQLILPGPVCAGLFAAILLCAPGYAQHTGVVVPEEKVGTPAAKPEPRRRVLTEPVVLLQDLTSSSAQARRLALQQLGVDTKDPNFHQRETTDARLLMVNLDADKELEAILIYTDSFATHALVFDKDNEGWWQVGAFQYWWHWNSEQAEHLIELREAVWPGRKDIVVREVSGGTGVSRIDLSIYRLHGGHLYRVFQTNEEAYYATAFEHREISYYDAGVIGRPAILVHRTKTSDATSPKATPLTKSDCAGYAWDASKFAFLEDLDTTAKLCDPGGR